MALKKEKNKELIEKQRTTVSKYKELSMPQQYTHNNSSKIWVYTQTLKSSLEENLSFLLNNGNQKIF